MKRVDLSWALKAVLPHVGTQPGAEALGTRQVGLEYRLGELYVYACDRYSAGIARVNDGINVAGSLARQEAVDLEQFVRTSYKTEEDGDFAFAVREHELHIGFERQVDRFGATEEDSAVFELHENSQLSLDFLVSTMARAYSAPVEWDEQIYAPKLLERFAKAARADADRLRIVPRHSAEHRGVAIVTVGQNFLGMISGLTYDQEGPATLLDFPFLALEAAA